MELESATEEITESELLDQHAEQTKRNIMVAMPAKVEAVTISSTAQTVDVTPQLNRSLPDGTGAYVSEPLMKLKGVPVGFMRGGGFFVSFPIAVGDYGMLICCDRNISQWRATGAQGDPGDLGLHTLDGAFFLPCVAPDANALQNADANNLVVGSDSNAAARIVIKPSGEIDAGGSTYSAPKWDAFAGVFDTFIGVLAGITTPVATLPQCAAALNSIIAAAITLQTAMSTNTDYKSTVFKHG